MKIIIPMSGQGKRFKDAGFSDPKPLIKVRDIPMIEHIVKLFPGETDIHCICNSEHLSTTDMGSILDSLGVKIYSIDPHKLGPVYSVLQCKDIIDDEEEVIVSYCDYGSDWNYETFKSYSKEYDGVIVAYKGFHPHMLFGDNYAFLRMDDENGKVLEIKEKESFTDNKMSEYASNGTYYFRKGKYLKYYFNQLIEKNIQVNGEYYISLVYNEMINDNKNIGVFEIDKMLQWGTPRDLDIYNMWYNHFTHIPKECNSNATLILPMAGRGSRFSMVGYKDPKPLLPIKNNPMVVEAVRNLPKCKENIFITLEEHLIQHDISNILSSSFPDIKIIGIKDVTEGQACTTQLAFNIDTIDRTRPILVSACDNGVDYDSDLYMELENNNDIDVIVWSFDNNPTSQLYPDMYTWLETDNTNTIKYVSVKKRLPETKQCIIGTMFFRNVDIFMEGYSQIISKNIRTNGEFYIDNILNELIEKGYTIKSFPVKNYICWGTPNDYRSYLYWEEHFNKLKSIKTQ